MRKILSTSFALLLATAPAISGGYLTNTNQSAAFLRNPARDAIIEVDGAYYNPAGLVFLAPGWHVSLNVQSAYQTRSATSTFGTDVKPFALGIGNRADGVKKFEGDAQAPVVPSLQMAYVKNKWAFSLSMAITGGGGKCVFDRGLGSFESQVAMLPVMINALQPGSVNGYAADSYMRGRQYYFGGQVGVARQLTDQLSVSVGGRLVYADCNYYGYVRNIQVRTANGLQLPVGDLFTAQNMPHFAAITADRNLNCDQTGWGFTPIVGIDWKTGRWNFAAKYEFKTRLRLQNRSGVNTSGLTEYDDGRSIAADIPAILTLGAQYEASSIWRVSAGFHYYFDKQATQHRHREEHLKGGGWEVLLGTEVDVTKRLTLSAGMQSTNYGLGDNSQFLTDISFVTNSSSLGFGAKVKLRDNLCLNVAYFKTFYRPYTKKSGDYNGLKTTFANMLGQVAGSGALTPQETAALASIQGGLSNFDTAGSDKFDRTNDVFGIGLDISF